MVFRHPTKDIQGSESSKLKGKTICLGMSGSVGVINSPAVARGLMRHGADVICVMSKEATDLIQPQLMQWATGNEVVTDISGNIEHIYIAGEREMQKGLADMILICPATANTISKIALGIDDTPVTTICTVAIGSNTPMAIVPAMHDSMYRSPILQENIQKLKKINVQFLGPRLLENKAKVALPEEVVEYVVNYFSNKKDLKGISFLITAGPSREFIDRVRFISNPSTGKMGLAFAEEIINRGGNATILLGPTSEKPPLGAKIINVTSALDFMNAMQKELTEKKYEVFISAAAIADFQPDEKIEEKLSSDVESLQINLKPTKKLINKAREMDKDMYIVAFKAETNLDQEKLIDKAHNRMENSRSNLVVANNVNMENKQRGFGAETNEVFVIDKEKNFKHIKLTTKKEIASQILDIIKNDQNS